MPDSRSALLRESLFAVVLFLAAVAVTVGASMLLPPAGWIVAGVLGVVWSVVVFYEAGS